MTARDVCTLRDCPLRASLRPWTNAPCRRSHRCSNTSISRNRPAQPERCRFVEVWNKERSTDNGTIDANNSSIQRCVNGNSKHILINIDERSVPATCRLSPCVQRPYHVGILTCNSTWF
ncbi:hypothetical protein IEO21_09575 [Rhodonia placenta]|uniref:Uncharacterized protein n=1 Tax=Rhodonia placenta TaxID=104341 RepID=A0A8H7NU25_9APHY|nr:hypothetical protein IEO21_09575 [Postia placenta]